MPEVSVIVPIYNSGKYVVSCLESLACQTLENIEIILVDDHGTDDSMDKVHRFISEYSGGKSFVCAETSTNSGPGAARNVGIELAKGEYVAFVDSDDYVEPSYCQELYGTAEAAGADMACCDAYWGEKVVVTNTNYRCKRYFLTHFVSYIWTYIFKKEFVTRNGITFPSTFCAEDTCFLTCCVLSADKIAQIHKPLYHYVLHEESISKKKNRRRASVRVRSIKSIIHFAKRNGLYSQYRCALTLLLLKKGYGMAIKDLLFG